MEPEAQPGKYKTVGKVAAVSAVVLLVSLGLCGVSMNHLQNSAYQGIGMAGLAGLGIGVLGLLGSALAAVIVHFTKN